MGWGAGRLWWRPVFEHAKSKLVVRSLKSQRQVVLLCRGAVLDGEREMIGLSLDVEVGIAPSMKLGAAAQCLPSAEVVGSFSSVVDDNNGEMKTNAGAHGSKPEWRRHRKKRFRRYGGGEQRGRGAGA